MADSRAWGSGAGQSISRHINYYINEELHHENILTVDIHIHVFLTSALDEGQWSASRSGSVIPEERATNIPFDRRLGESGRRGESNPNSIAITTAWFTASYKQSHSQKIIFFHMKCLLSCTS